MSKVGGVWWNSRLKAGGVLYAVEAQARQEVWRFQVESVVVGEVVMAGGCLRFCGSGDKIEPARCIPDRAPAARGANGYGCLG
jgi:hypothetical protein